MGDLNVGSLFSGIGGIDLAFEREGFEISWQVEWEPYCQEVLKKHFPKATVYGDIRAIDWATVEPVDILIGGFPCQPHSVAGKKKGSRDERDLWPEFVRAIRSLRPAWVVAENVPGILSSNNGRFFKGVLGDLAQEGYDAEWFTLSAAEVGAPHKRERLFIVARPNSATNGGQNERGVHSEGEISECDGTQNCPPWESDRTTEGQRNKRYEDTSANSHRLGAHSQPVPPGKDSPHEIGKLSEAHRKRPEQSGAGKDAEAIPRPQYCRPTGGLPADSDIQRLEKIGPKNEKRYSGRPPTFFVADDWGERISRFKLETIQGKQGFSRFQDVRNVEELFHRPDIPQPLIRRGGNGLPRKTGQLSPKERTQAIGNSVVPQVAQFIARRMEEIIGGIDA